MAMLAFEDDSHFELEAEIAILRFSRKYRRVIDLPSETNIQTATSTYKNGMLEIVFEKKKQSEAKGKQINLE